MPRVGIPFAERKVAGGKCSATCPECKAEIPLTKRKDGESWSGAEYAEHWEKEHASA